MDFVNNVIDCECLGYVFCFKIGEKEKQLHILYELLFYNIPPKFLFFIFYLLLYIFNFSLLQLNNYNGYVCAIYNCCFL